MKITNSANSIRNGRKVKRMRSESRQSEIRRKLTIEKTWKPVIKKLRRKFRDQFRAIKWNDIYIGWRGEGYSEDYLTNRVSPYLRYEIHWRGLEIRRCFSPKCIEDISIEAWKIGDVLVAWHETQAEITK
jgi:hypothetical protein